MSNDYYNWSMDKLREERDEWGNILDDKQYANYSYAIRKLTAINAEIARRIPQIKDTKI